MAACGSHFATTCFEHIIAYISRTARDNPLKFGMHIHLNRHYLYPKWKVYRYYVIRGQRSKNRFLPISWKVFGLRPWNLVGRCCLSPLRHVPNLVWNWPIGEQQLFVVCHTKSQLAVSLYCWGRYHQQRSSQLITLKSRIFPVKNANLQSSGLVGLVAKSSVFKTGQFWNLLSSHLRFWVSFNLLSSQRLIFRLPKNPVTPQSLVRNQKCLGLENFARMNDDKVAKL